MEAPEIIERLKSAMGDAVTDANVEVVDPYVVIDPARIHDCIAFLRDKKDLKFDYLMSLAGIDYMGISEANELGVIYHLYSYEHRHTIVVRTMVDREDPKLPSISDLYGAAQWQEREAFDMYGIVFDGNPDLRRILLPPGWEGYPMRNDWKEPDEILGISTQRRSLRERLEALKAENNDG